MKIQWSLIAGLIFALLTALFAVINVDPVQVNFGFDVVSIPLILVILGCALIGGIIVGSYGIFRQYKLQKQIKIMTAELTKLRDANTSMESMNIDQDRISTSHSTQL
ncbi:LapA family protein [Paenibacillus wynnii]|uniref:LapA family protein n=1 Tax=Paenibacillus wynnii TaxID=268407 RepID=UPI00278CA3B8|nr:lipopolysaccharide assembly protein LapA domain-containing protein [Paenibacillus wynnii]MDQ0195865.1 putative integral membrane protein [Paenibacillus wynnii]